MTKRLFAILFALVLVFSISLLSVGAQSAYSVKLDDAANLLTPEEEAQLTDIMNEVSVQNQCNLAFVTVNDLNGASFYHYGTTQDYADMYYETYFGQDTDGIVVLLVLSDEYGRRTIYFSTSVVKGTTSIFSYLPLSRWNNFPFRPVRMVVCTPGRAFSA